MTEVKVQFVREQQAITGDWFRIYEALDDGERIEVRTRCGAYADGLELSAHDQPKTDAEADAYAAQELAARRMRRATR